MISRQHGFSLVELMISMTIGIFLIGGALFVYDEAQSTMRINESLARMQENARWALDIMEPDLRMAGYWGRHTAGATIAGRASSINPLAVNIAQDCGNDWSIDTDVSIEGFNNEQPTWNCIGNGQWHGGTDSIAVRHASGRAVDTADLEAGRIYIRTHEAGRGALFAGTAEPPIGEGQNNLLLAHAYYVRPNTINDDGVPSLRRRQLGTGPALIDQEIIPGVEDLQVQFGIDSDGNGTVDRYVNPDNAALNAGPVVRAVRVWLRMRSESPEIGFTDTRTYTYADREYTPAADEADFRRLLVSRTIFLRNEAIPEASL